MALSENGRTADHDIDPIFLNRWSPRAFTGEAMPQDYVQAWKWLTLANTGAPAGYEKAAREEAVALRNAITAKMTPMQISDAQKQIREWSPQ